jgi:UPF0755 protein
LKKLTVALTALLVIAVAVVSIGAMTLRGFLHAPVSVAEQGAEFEISAGESFGRVSENLEQRGVISNSDYFRAYARWKGQASAVQAGHYFIEHGSTPVDLLNQFINGDVQLESFTIVEGWNHRELLQAMRDHAYIDASMTDEDWPALLQQLGAAVVHPEGLFLPETYLFPRHSSDQAVLRQAYDLMQEALAEEWAERDEGLPISTPYEALILASIVEKETARADERERIAGVFVRRLEQRKRLETDPTVIYGMGPSFNGNLTRKDLRTDTPYNTYTRRGLPPTPIALAGRAAIYAALHPADGKELFFVATGIGDGSHKFSATNDEHNAAVAEYLQRLRQQRKQGR